MTVSATGPANMQPVSRQGGRVNRLAAAAFVLVWVPPVGGIPAVVLGSLAFQEIDASGGSERGKELAVWAIVLGLINIIAVIVGVFLLVHSLSSGDTGHVESFGCRAWEEVEGLC